MAALDLDRFDVLTFDCYGTLIDWESGILDALRAPLGAHGITESDDDVLAAFARHEAEIEAGPYRRYRDVLGEVLAAMVGHFGAEASAEERTTFGGSVADWPAFPDSADALAALARHYELIILSNVHRAGFAASNQRLRGDFATIITAEDVGAYKPAENHFRALDATLAELGVDRGALLHVAQSLFHDHVPARREGLPSVWINRRHDRPGWGATPAPAEEWTFAMELPSMAALADAVDRAFGDR